MYKHKPQTPETVGEELSIVMIGDFNPKIFQPFWFSSQKLIRESEAEAATVELIHSDFTSFSTDWFVMQVARERFTLTVKSSAYKNHLFDLSLGTFKSLVHTPINQMGLNIGKTIRFKSPEDWHAFGHFIIPKQAWDGILTKPGLRSSVTQGQRNDELPGSIIFIVEPVLINSNNEVSVKINNHFELKTEEKNKNANYFINIIEHEFEKSVKESNDLIDKLVEKFVSKSEFDDGISK